MSDAEALAEEYQSLMAAEPSLDSHFVEEDLACQIQSGALNPETAGRVLEHLGIGSVADADML